MNNPGWVDLQVNGHKGVDYSDPNLTAEDFIRSAEALIADGTEVFCPVIITSPLEIFRRNSEIIINSVEKYGLSKKGRKASIFSSSSLISANKPLILR